jgi:hypothetical protein
MEDIFLNVSYSNLQQLLIRIFSFLFVSGILLYIIYFALSKILFKKSSHPRVINLRLVFLWSLFAYFVVFNVYFYILFYKNGTDSLHWTSLSCYLGIMAQIIIYILILIFFFVRRQSLNKIINEKSIT